MKNNKKTENNSYAEARKIWAREQAELFLNILEKIGDETEIRITPMQYVKAYKLCIEEYKFEYPAEYKLTELISSGDEYEQMLTIMAEVMKRFRLSFQREYKRQFKHRQKRADRSSR